MFDHILEVDSDEKDEVVIWALSREGVWLPFMAAKITESTFNCYRMPLILGVGYRAQTDQLNEQLSESELRTPQALDTCEQ